MGNIITTIKKFIDDFFEQNKYQIYSAAGLILLVDILFAVPFFQSFLATGQCRDYMIFGGSLKACSFSQFTKFGILWLSFADSFIFLPVIVWAMIMPSLVENFKAQREEE